MGSCHINMKFQLSPALFPILLHKSDIFGLYKLTFFAVKTFWVVPETLQWYQIDHRTSADPGG